MASSTWRPRHKSQFAYAAIMAPIDDPLGIGEQSEDDTFEPSLDPQYADLPCYVPLIDDNGLEPFALDALSERQS